VSSEDGLSAQQQPPHGTTCSLSQGACFMCRCMYVPVYLQCSCHM
jgi:hypothetical protein